MVVGILYGIVGSIIATAICDSTKAIWHFMH